MGRFLNTRPELALENTGLPWCQRSAHAQHKLMGILLRVPKKVRHVCTQRGLSCFQFPACFREMSGVGGEEKGQLWVTFQSIGADCLAECKVTSATREAWLQPECHSRLNHQERAILSSLQVFLKKARVARKLLLAASDTQANKQVEHLKQPAGLLGSSFVRERPPICLLQRTLTLCVSP